MTGRLPTDIRKVVLVAPPMQIERVYGELADFGSVSPPTGLCYIAAYLRAAGFDVSIIDAEALGMGVDEAVRAILKDKPDIVGITCKTLWVKNAHRVAAALKKENPNLLIVAGSNHVTALPERSLREFSSFDIIIIGEGEITFLEMIKALNEGKDPSGVNGLAFSINGRVHITPPRARIRDLDSLPMPAYDLLPELSVHYKPVLAYCDKLPAFSIVASRGCPMRCTFCDRGVFGNSVTKHSPEYTVKLIKELYYKYGIRYLMFDDDNLLQDKRHLIRLLELMKESGLKIPFTCQSRVDTLDEERLKLLKQAGCRHILFGIESGSQRILDAMKKGITVEQIRNAVRITNKAGIKPAGFFILGYPGETEETMQETVNLIRECKLSDVGVFLFSPLPGSEIYNDVNKYGTYIEDWDKGNAFDDIVFVPKSLTGEKLLEYSARCNDACYLNARQMLTAVTRITSWAHAKSVIKFAVKMLLPKKKRHEDKERAA